MNHAHSEPAINGANIIPISVIRPSPTNPRKSFDEAKLAQLADTIKAQGFLQRLLVRPWPGEAGAFELVDGERRWRAAKLLGIAELPVEVRALSDAQVIEIQLVAGETGEPLSALEEAAGFKTALDLKGKTGEAVYTLRSLAEKLGCSKSHIEQRIDLLRLPSAVREWVSTGTLAPRTANLLARIPDAEAREKAIRDIVFPKHRDDPLPFREAEVIVHERYMMSLRGAPFDVADATLDGPEQAPLACSSCPWKTGNNPERFGDVKDKNTCTNPVCYRAKCNTAWERTAAKAKAAGQRVLTDEETAEVFEKNSPVVQIAFSSPYVDVDSKPTYRHVPNEIEDSKLPTWREMIETAEEKKSIKVPIVLARDRTGKQWQLVQLVLAIEAARAIGEDIFKKVPVNESLSTKDRFDRDAVRNTVRATDDFAERKKAEAKALKKRTAETLIGLERLQFIGAGKFTQLPVLQALLTIAIEHAGIDGQALFAKAVGLKTKGGDFAAVDAIDEWFHRADDRNKQSIVMALLVAKEMKWSGLKAPGFCKLAGALHIDVKKIETEAAAKSGAENGKKKKPQKEETPEKKGTVRVQITPDIRDEVHAQALMGRTNAEIAKAVGISVASVQNIKKGVGLVKERAEKRDAAKAAVAAVRSTIRKKAKG